MGWGTDVPDALAEVIGKALDRDPTKRFDTARQFGSALVDALTNRPWTQGEIGDYVRANFATEIVRRSEQVASAIHRTKPSEAGRSTMPLIVHDSEATTIDETELDDEFPAVESTVSELPRDTRGVTDFQGSTPQPFGADSSTSGYQLKPLDAKRIERAPQKRGVLWPILAIAMVGIAGASLFLVWKQMQQQPPAVVNITSEPSQPQPVNVPEPNPGSGSSEPAPTGGSAKPPPKRPTPGKPTKAMYLAAVQPHKTSLERCAKDQGLPPSNAKITILVTTSGKAKTVSLEPAALDASPLGACIKNVLSAAKYPTDEQDARFSFDLKAN